MRGLIKLIGRIALSLVALVAGCWWDGGGPAHRVELPYGIVPPPHDPTVTIEDFSYTPASPVSRDATLVFRMETNKPTDTAWATVRVGEPTKVLGVPMYDNGNSPDELESDGIWTGEWQLPPELDPGTYQIRASLGWYDGYEPLEISGEPLEIEEAE